MKISEFNIDLAELEKNTAKAAIEKVVEVAAKAKKYTLLNIIKEEASKRFSIYRQRKYDLLARIVTEWPKWGLSVDFINFFVLPLLKNTFQLHFINLSDSYSLKNTKIEAGYFDSYKKEVQYVKLKDKDDKKLELCDFTVCNIIESSEIYEDENIYVQYKKDLKINFENLRSDLIRVRDGDIGVQAFFLFIEGILRNAVKHREDKSDFTPLELKIILFNSLESLNRCIDKHLSVISEYEESSYLLLSINKDIERKINYKGEFLSEFLHERFSSQILGDDGQIIAGCWGIKELKIAASFLAGASLQSVNETYSDCIRVGICSNVLWEDGQERICYILRIEKPRYVIAVVPENEKPDTSDNPEWQGFKFIEGFNELKKINPSGLDNKFDYDFLFIDDQAENHDLIEYCEENYSKIPRRVVFGSWDELNSAEEKLDIVIELYKRWLKKICESKFRNEIVMGLLFDDDELRKKWKDLEGELSFDNFEICFPVDLKNKTIRISHHGTIVQDLYLDYTEWEKFRRFSHILPHKAVKAPYYYQKVSNADQFFNFFSSLLQSNNIEKGRKSIAKIVALQLLESTLLNILIVDERIAQASQNKMAQDEPTIPLIDKLYWMGINIAKKIITNNMPLESFIDETKSRYVSFGINKTNDETSFTHSIDDLPIDILFIHYTKLKMLSKEMNISDKEIIEMLREKIPHVIVHTGSGKTNEFPLNTLHLEYSTLNKYILQEPSKYYLTQIALNLKE